ncbi:MAG: hypothetical protein ACK5IJ_08475 [Mangrovibacterium sp.]
MRNYFKPTNLAKLSFAILLISVLGFVGCSEEELPTVDMTEPIVVSSAKEKSMNNFASILSQAVSEREDIRQFLKDEALKQFDKNFDVLYYLVRDEIIGAENETFRDVLISHSSEKIMEEIENAVPLLNILLPEIPMLEVFPKDLDVSDNEIPVATTLGDGSAIYFNGVKEHVFASGEVPGFHLFVINENSRVIIDDIVSKSSSGRGEKSIRFKSENYDGSIVATKGQVATSSSIVGTKAVNAWRYFYKDDGSSYQKGFQRDYIYYGITPTKQSGSLNNSVTEYISYIKIDPSSYFDMADQDGDGIIKGNGISASTDRKSKALSVSEQYDRLWKSGAYNIRFEVSTSLDSKPYVVYIPLKPSEIWDFNTSYSYRNSTWFRKSKHSYTINANDFTAKSVFLSTMVNIGKWDISKEALHRHVSIYEEDPSEEITDTYTYEMSKAASSNFSLSGEKKTLGLNGSASTTNSTTEKITKTVTVKRTKDSDPLGETKIFFYDPVVSTVSGSTYYMNTYSTGTVEFGVVVK